MRMWALRDAFTLETSGQNALQRGVGAHMPVIHHHLPHQVRARHQDLAKFHGPAQFGAVLGQAVVTQVGLLPR